MQRRHLLSALAGAGLAALGGCLASAPQAPPANSAEKTPGTGTPPDVDVPTDRFVAGNANFGFALLNRLADDEPNENRFTSPYSVGMALAMTYAGARGQTREEIAETMHFPSQGEDLHRAAAGLRSALPLADTTGTPTPTPTPPEETPTGESGAPFRLAAANALWGQTGYPFREAFLETLSRYYGGGFGEVDFRASPDAARGAINDWVANRTRERIPELFPEGVIDERTRLVLANAVYFRANWADTFDEDATEPGTFTALDGTEGDVPMMRQQEPFRYAERDGTKVLVLPYAGGDTDMVLLLPPREGFRDFEAGLDAEQFADLVDATEKEEVNVSLPRFEFRTKLDLAGQLQAMGMSTAFTREANFDGIAEGDADADLALGAVLHEAYVKVDEEGTEAAAATGVEVELVSEPMNPPEFVADRPFLFVIRHRPTGAPLFVGRVVDAVAAQG